MKQLIKNFKHITMLLLVVSFISCEENEILPKVTAGFTYTINADTGTVTFINTSEAASTFEWNFADETTSTEINPIYTFPSGEYTVTLKASHVSGASDTFKDIVTVLIPEIATIPITFDGANTKYETEVFGGASFSIVPNPDASGANTSTSNVGEIKNVGAQFEGFYIDLGTDINLETEKTIKTLFWSDKAVDVLVKLEEGGTPTEATASHGGSGWEILYFTFDSISSYSRFTMFVDGSGTTAGTFYVDDIMQIDSSTIPCTETMLNLPIDFDCNGIGYEEKIVGNVSFTVVDNPELSGINSMSSKVGQITNVGVNWENAFFNLDTGVDFTTEKAIKMKFYSTQALQIKLKFEDGTEAPIENDQNHTGTGWEELTFTLNSSGSYNDMVLFVDGPGTASGVFYVDDIEQVAETVMVDTGSIIACNDGTLVNGFEVSDNTIFSNFGGGVGTIVDNTDKTVNSSAKKARYVKNAGEPFGGITVGLDANIPLTGGTFSIDVKSQSVRQLLFKLEGLNIEKILPTSGTGWETITYDFSDVTGSTGDVTGITLIMDNGTVGDGNADWTIDFDNIRLCSNGGSASTGSTILDFENNLTNVTASEFETSGQIIANPVSGTINTSGNVYEATFTNGNQWWGGVGFAFADNVLDTQATEYKVKLFATVAPMNVLFQIEVDGTNAPVGDVQTITTANEWVEVTFNVTGVPSGSNRILVRPDVGDQSGTKPNGGTLYIDDIICEGCTLNSSVGSTVSDCPAPPAGELLSNGGFEANNGDGTCWQFNVVGGTVAVSSEEVNGGTYAAKMTTGVNQAPNIKMERFATATTGGVNIQVSFKYKITTALGSGSILQVLAFSEKANGDGAALHELSNANAAPLNTWNTYTQTFTTDAAIAEGISLLIQLTGSGEAGADGVVYIDDVVVTQL